MWHSYCSFFISAQELAGFISSESNLALWGMSGSVPVRDSLSALSTDEGVSQSKENEWE